MLSLAYLLNVKNTAPTRQSPAQRWLMCNRSRIQTTVNTPRFQFVSCIGKADTEKTSRVTTSWITLSCGRLNRP